MKDLRNRIFRFDNVEIDVQNLRVTVDSEIRPLEPKSFRLMMYLVENPGRVLSKDEIMGVVWPDASVSDNSLARAIGQIRKALGEDPKAPKYVETIPSVGYRFLVDCRQAEEPPVPPADPPMEVIPAQEPPVRPRKQPWLWPSVVAGVVLLNAGLWFAKRPAPPPLPQKLVPVTTYAGSEEHPSFSPDGKQIAFYWDGDKGLNPGIYVKLLGETNALRLTSGHDAFPAWSPDGKRIAFVRGVIPRTFNTGHALYTMSALGGEERKILDIEASRQISWSPDGKWIALAQGGLHGSAIFALSPEGGEPRRLSNPKRPAFDTVPAFSPDGHRLAYAHCSIRYSCDIYVQELKTDGTPDGSPRQVTRQGTEIYGLTWSRGARSVVYSAAHMFMTPYLWRTGSDGREAPQRVEIAGPMAFAPSASPGANHLVYEKSLLDADIWRYRAGGGLEPLITSSLSDFAPQYSPDGSKIAFCSNRSGERMEIWVAQADGSRPVQLTNGPGRNQGTPRWSPDGRWIAFDSAGQDGHFEIYVVEASGSSPRKVTSESMNTYMPFWPPDGKWIYFSANSQIWRVPFAGGRAEQITTRGASMAYFSDDGTTLFYTKHDAGPVFARLLSGGEERQVLPYVHYKAFFPTADGIYYVGARNDEGSYPLEFYQFSGKTSRVLEKIGGSIFQGMSVSPDGKSILLSRSVNTGSDLMMIENFQ
jgi:Tol biopolymer transport system component/DNA-binding winged helix-turn-helix (wHTH) protein